MKIPAPTVATALRAQLAMRLYNAVTDIVSDVEVETLAGLAGLMAAVLRNELYTPKDATLLHAIEASFPPDHAVWKTVQRPEGM